MPESRSAAAATPKNYYSDEEIASRGGYLGVAISDGRYSIPELLAIREALNGLLTDGKSTHVEWIKKPHRAEDADDAAYRLVLGSRVAPALARLKWLDYQHVTDEDDLDVFTISLAQAGYSLLDSVDECYEFFDKKALSPIREEKDIPAAGKARPCRKAADGALKALQDDFLRVGPYRAVLAEEKAELLEDLKAKLGALSPVEREAIGLSEAPKDADMEEPKDAVQGAQESAAIGAGMAAGLAPLMTTLEALLTGIQGLATQSSTADKRLKVEVKKADSDSDEDEAQLSVDERLLRELTLGCVATNSTSKKMSMKDMQLNQAVRRINDCQKIRRKVDDSEYSSLFNASLAEETVWLVRLEKIDHLKDRTLTPEVLNKCKVKEEHIQEMLEGEKQKQEMLEMCIEEQSLGNHREAAECSRIYSKMLAQDFRSPLCKKIREQARTNVKQDRDSAILEHIAKGSSNSFVDRRPTDRRQQDLRQNNKRQREVGTDRVAPHANRTDRGSARTSNDYKMRPWVDGSVYNSSLAGVNAPDPADFGGYFKARLDQPGIDGEMGKVHRPGWLGRCGCCAKVGHSLSECPSARWSEGGKDHVNFRWLYSKGFCQPNGQPQ